MSREFVVQEAEQTPERVSRLVIEWSQKGVAQEHLTPSWRFWLPLLLGILGIAATIAAAIWL